MVEKARNPQEIDDIEDRMGPMRELDFSDKRDERQGRVGDERPQDEVEREFPPERVEHAGMSGGEALEDDTLEEDQVTYDDLSPGTLYDETGANSPEEAGPGGASDSELSVVDESDIGGGIGLDEAELARSAPLDGEPWTDDVIDEEER
ncbi:hypothetical protein D3C76_525120 [compost metagenome]|uniref:Phosphotransferase system, HPr-related protein n=1 Tax=Pseudomonas jinjuensis TaxID=198616 RepID=A0A1H0LH21_9PSED|nr:phosphotransferase system, HPr-related protein [Pseudomonas jinjuensis]SDO67356.1 hypothetical protein SAMN05216193_11462 [Pseudomonas jinjuensis]